MTSGPSDKGSDQNRWVEKLDVGQAIDTGKRPLHLFELDHELCIKSFQISESE